MGIWVVLSVIGLPSLIGIYAFILIGKLLWEVAHALPLFRHVLGLIFAHTKTFLDTGL
jgi:hypothetical protein